MSFPDGKFTLPTFLYSTTVRNNPLLSTRALLLLHNYNYTSISAI